MGKKYILSTLGQTYSYASRDASNLYLLKEERFHHLTKWLVYGQGLIFKQREALEIPNSKTASLDVIINV